MKNIDLFRIGRYRHYKGNEYQVLDIATHSETEEKLVVYKPIKDIENNVHGLWVRPFDMFFEDVSVAGKKVPRFEFIE